LTSVAALTLCLAIGTTSWAVTERVLINDGAEEGKELDLKQVLGTIAHTALNLPRSIQAICTVQFWAWIGTLLMCCLCGLRTNDWPGWFPFLFYSTTWVGEVYLRYDAPAEVKAAGDLTGKVGRIGSMALIAFSIITFVMSVLLPFFVQSPEDDEKGPGFSHPPKRLTGLAKYKPSLLTAWTTAHCIFAGSMVMAPFVRSLRHATIIIACCGV
jgi:solute carrier family 45 protein 1/2/4